ncbi:hypothetical protein RE6C_04008 [Rhodopirellula europaea 6C]|uniref:Uncharacterized protein n=1 Tax=Rhodopirellula europaea 6C TaxID=1263867 RepID=M2A579_9BACT|nr:hypothetical protein RE6C_04008 [Rhodopirellula europaea 6C]
MAGENSRPMKGAICQAIDQRNLNSFGLSETRRHRRVLQWLASF